MACDICGRGSCCTSFHSLEEQRRYEKVIEAFERARDLRERVRNEVEEEEREAAEVDAEPCSFCGSFDCNGECSGDGLMGG